jgi:hypothetical protein
VNLSIDIQVEEAKDNINIAMEEGSKIESEIKHMLAKLSAGTTVCHCVQLCVFIFVILSRACGNQH